MTISRSSAKGVSVLETLIHNHERVEKSCDYFNFHFPVCVYFFDNCPPQFLVTGNPLSQCSSLQKLRCLIFKKSNSNILLDVQNYIIGKRFLPQSHL